MDRTTTPTTERAIAAWLMRLDAEVKSCSLQDIERAEGLLDRIEADKANLRRFHLTQGRNA